MIRSLSPLFAALLCAAAAHGAHGSPAGPYVVAESLAAPLTAGSGGNATTEWQTVYCPSSTATKCDFHWSGNTYGCCTMPDAVCCANGYTCCPSGTTCVDSGSSWAVVTKCVPSTPSTTSTVGKQICKIGPQFPPSATRKNVMIFGDSVSIGYTPFVAEALASKAFVQHIPWPAGDGGACTTAYALQCLDFFLSSPSGQQLTDVDVLYFNSGLHNLLTNGTGVPGQSGNTSVYMPELKALTQRIQAWAQPRGVKVVFALTSAFLCSVATDDIVVHLNEQAAAVMAAAGIDTINLHDPIVAKCGAAPVTDCFGVKDCFCPHCPTAGYAWLAQNTIAPAISKLLE